MDPTTLAICAALVSAVCVMAAPTPANAPVPVIIPRVANVSGAVVTTQSDPSQDSEYIAMLDCSATSDINTCIDNVLAEIGLTTTSSNVVHIYNNSAFHGFAVSIPSSTLATLEAVSEVAHIEAVQSFGRSSVTTRSNSPWGLQRISQSASLAGNNPSYATFTYTYDDTGSLGAGVDIYVVDSGINTANEYFGGRAVMGWAANGTSDEEDLDGHGTHVAGTAGSNPFGVASGANIIGVKVLGANGAGSSSDVVAGIDYVVQTHESRIADSDFIGSIASISFGLDGRSTAIESAITAAVTAGVHVSVASGNQATDACTVTPGAVGGSGGPAVAVGSINISDEISSFSNTGSCVDVYAPGEYVLSTFIGSTTATALMSGTSMSCPHVTGIMAYLMAQNETLAGCPALMKEYISSSALSGIITNVLLANNGQTGS